MTTKVVCECECECVAFAFNIEFVFDCSNESECFFVYGCDCDVVVFHGSWKWHFVQCSQSIALFSNWDLCKTLSLIICSCCCYCFYRWVSGTVLWCECVSRCVGLNESATPQMPSLQYVTIHTLLFVSSSFRKITLLCYFQTLSFSNFAHFFGLGVHLMQTNHGKYWKSCEYLFICVTSFSC